jgi:hypothetical protein
MKLGLKRLEVLVEIKQQRSAGKSGKRCRTLDKIKGADLWKEAYI